MVKYNYYKVFIKQQMSATLEDVLSLHFKFLNKLISDFLNKYK